MRSEIKRKKFIERWKKKPKNEYNAMDFGFYFRDLYYKHLKIRCSPLTVRGMSQIKGLQSNWSNEDICKAMRWFIRPRNYEMLLTNPNFPPIPTWGAFFGFGETIFSMSQAGINMDENKKLMEDRKLKNDTKVVNKKSVKKSKLKNNKSGEWQW